jgi:hypothetical protein
MCVIDLGFKSVAGHPCLFIRITVVAGKIIVIVIGIFVDDLLNFIGHRKFCCRNHRSQEEDE